MASLLFGSEGFAHQISQAPVCVIGGCLNIIYTVDLSFIISNHHYLITLGLLFGVVWGILLKFIPESGDAYVIPIRTLMLFAGGILAVFGSEHIGYEGAGPLAVVFAAFVG